MAANDNVAGKVSLWAGKTFSSARRITAEIDSALLDNAVGSKAVSFAPAGRVYEQIPLDSMIQTLPAGPHILPGENLYVAIDPTTNAKAVDSTGQAGTVVKLKYLLRDRATGHKEVRSIDSESPRNTTLIDGGLTDDMTVYAGRPNAVYAFKVAAPDTDATILGHAQIDIRTSA